jgi:protein tyrosine phosphatase (PTP) superfamily phosphohydrolase (DUF442 family)
LFRGAQPLPGGLRRLSELGINTIVNLRGTDSLTRNDEAEAVSLGLKYFNVPLPTWGRPEDSRVRRILEILVAPENGRVFVHCKNGVDRTGMIVALYRITAEGRNPVEAKAEAMRYGMSGYQYWKRDYIDDYYKSWRSAGVDQKAMLQTEYDEDFKDHLGGTAVRAGERAVSQIHRVMSRVIRKVRQR